MDRVHKRLLSLLDGNISVPIEREGVQEQLHWVEDDGQIRGVNRHAISKVIVVEKAADVFPQLFRITGVHNSVDDLFELFLKEKKIFATDKVLATIPVSDFEGRAILGSDLAHDDAFNLPQ